MFQLAPKLALGAAALITAGLAAPAAQAQPYPPSTVIVGVSIDKASHGRRAPSARVRW